MRQATKQEMRQTLGGAVADHSNPAIQRKPAIDAIYRESFEGLEGLEDQEQPVEALLHRNPKLWRGYELYGQGHHGYSTGFPELDDILPGRGWPRSGLVEVVARHRGMGELQLLVPLMRSMIAQSKWILWVAPPYQFDTPALVQAGIDTRQVLIVKADTSCRDALCSMEKALQMQNCGLVLAWQNWLPGRVLRRLQLAGETGETLGILFKHSHSKYSPSPMRLKIEGSPNKESTFSEAEVTLLKAWGNFRPFTIRLNLYQHRAAD